MKKIIVIAMSCAMAFSMVACTQAEKEVATWGTGGAAIGALGGAAFGKGSGAVLGGAAAGALIGGLIGYTRTKDNVRYCNYRDNNGRIYEAPCR